MSSPRIYPSELIQRPMRQVVSRLKELELPLRSMRALEFFAREGDWHTVSYAEEVAALDAWEINPLCEPALRRNLPMAQIKIGDSFSLARQSEFANVFDMLVLDNPLCIFGLNDSFCEHFEALESVPFLLKPHGILIFNINYNPYGYEVNPEWRHRRKMYYGIADAAQLDFTFAERFYRTKMKELGLIVKNCFIVDRHDGVMAYVVMVV